MLKVNFLCENIVNTFGKFPVCFLSGKMSIQSSCFPCTMATLEHGDIETMRNDSIKTVGEYGF